MHATLVALIVAALGQLGAASAPNANSVPPSTPALPPAAAPSPTAVGSPGLNGDCELRHVTINSDQDVVISAEVEGTLTKLPIKEGMRVEAHQLLGTIDERQALAALEVADLQHKAALEKANDMVEEKFAKESADYARLDLGKDLKANSDSKGAVPDINIEQKRLAYKKAALQIEKAQKDRLIAQKEADAKKGELKAAEIAVERRTIRAPFAGVVQQVMQREAQWVNPGDPVLRLVQFDTLRADGFVKASAFDPVELAGRKATLTVHLARGRTATATGRIVFVSQILIGENYQVRAEFPNQRDGQFWLIRPGLEADMTIHLNEPPVETPPANATAHQ
jgi:multidrug efflux pump subunit AcrA (membrane-fusion protein)